MKKLLLAAAAAAATLASAGTASALTVGFEMVVTSTGATNDRPLVRIQNTSTSGLTLTAFTLNIGGTNTIFDRADTFNLNPTGSASQVTTALLVAGDAVNNGQGVKTLGFTFTGFDLNDLFSFRAEIDVPGTNATNSDFRTIFFNNGGIGVANAEATATFSNGQSLDVRFGSTSNSSLTTYTVSASATEFGETSPVPLPAALPLAALGFGALGLVARRRARG